MATTSIAITPGSGDLVRVVKNSGVDGNAAQQVFSLAGADGILAPTDPDGTLQVSPEPSTLLLDDFSVALSSFWTTGGTAPTISGGVLVTNAGTTANATSYMRSSLFHMLRAGTFLQIAYNLTIEGTAVANNTRWWGWGQNQSTPTAAAPILHGAVFLIDSANSGALEAVTFSNGTKTIVATLTRPTDGLAHRYQITYRQSRIYWLIDGVPVATVSQPSLAVATGLYAIVGSANTSTAPSAYTFSITSASVADQAAQNKTISDWYNPAIQVAVKAGSTAVAAADQPMAVGLHPSSPLPAGSSVIGAVGVGATAQSASFSTSTTTNAATVAKTSAGNLQALVISNTSTSAQWVKLYNATSVTLGTTAAVVDIPVAAGANVSLNLGANGLRFTTGIAYAVTGAVGSTNNTAGAGGVLVAATFV